MTPPIPSPGFTNPETRYDRPQIVATEQDKCEYVPIVVIAGADLPAGQVVGRITASGLYANYDNAETDGTEDAVGILTEDADAASAAVTTRMLITGVVFDAKLTGSNAAALVDLFARQITDGTGTVLLKL